MYIFFRTELNLGWGTEYGFVPVLFMGQSAEKMAQEAHDAVWASYLRILHGKDVDLREHPDVKNCVSVELIKLNSLGYGEIYTDYPDEGVA